jgi:hypothetical protein
MKKNEVDTVNTILVRTTYVPNSEIIKPDEEGDLITFGKKPTAEIVKEMIVLINPKMELKEVHRLLLKVVNQIENKLNHG